jgi:hypothetical protein
LPFLCFLVPKLCLGTAFWETLFPGHSNSRETEFPDRGSQTEFGNQRKMATRMEDPLWHRPEYQPGAPATGAVPVAGAGLVLESVSLPRNHSLDYRTADSGLQGLRDEGASLASPEPPGQGQEEAPTQAARQRFAALRPRDGPSRRGPRHPRPGGRQRSHKYKSN